jgi:uncharacterized protein (DUF1697 family)
MPSYIALLRGVNVGGNTLRMERLRALCEELGLKDVRTYVQSGNVVFAAGRSSAHWARTLAQALAGEARLPVLVIVRSATDMARIVADNPFLKEKGIDTTKLHVTFLENAPARNAVKALEALPSGADRFVQAGEEIYVHCPNGYGNTKLSNTAFEKALGLRATTRNWNTVNKLREMAKT